MLPNNITRIDLNAVSPLTEIIVRAGDLRQNNATQVLMKGYTQYRNAPGVYGLSVVFHQGYNLDQ